QAPAGEVVFLPAPGVSGSGSRRRQAWFKPYLLVSRQPYHLDTAPRSVTAMIRPSVIVALLLVPAAALAQNGAVTPGALDLSIPQAPMRYLDDPAYQSDAPGTFYGDHSDRGLRKDNGNSPVVDEKLQVHG